ncbi:protein 4.1 isoform X1 [Carassius carassius]|uniref:protein 4.1 isoform X1 n=2 Tax=Carassius carassius TaxID=217509 RepID=UPI0028697B9F|nr:protein 4.1 isoform X1 [Carassius carassius]XP_059366008.1 protein 4.1 isoform X1 [Carassius carassius]
MTTDEVESVHKKQVCEQQQEEENPAVQEPGPTDTAQDSSSGTSPPPGGSEEEQQLKPRQRTSAGRGLSRLFSSFLKRRSQCSDGEGVETERARDKDSQEEPKAPIADPEPELRIEGDVALDQHSVSSAENQQIVADQKEDAELESGKGEMGEKGEKKEKKKEKKEKADKERPEKPEKKEKAEKKEKKDKKEKKEKKNEDKAKGEEGEKDKECEKEKEKVEEEAKPEDACAAETEVKEEGEIEEAKQEENTVEEEEGKKQKASRRPRIMHCKVKLLDDSLFECELEKHAKGQDLFAKVCDHLNLLEKDYYGLAIWETPTIKTWLDFTKEIRRQVQGSNYDFTFNVKFYPPDPAQLSEDITRYYLCLQLRKDIKNGRLPCSFVTLALLGSYALQSELGEYDPEVHAIDYAKELQLIPGQTRELEEKVMELHRTYRSMSPAQADMMFLENAKKLAMYGVDLHQAKDLDGVDIMLGVCSSGLMVYKDKLRINRFPWPKVLKVSYKRSSFFIKIRPSDLEHYESAIGFKLPNYKAAKKLWKVCVEHHTFFRLTSTEAATTPRKFLALGSKFRYSGRTQAQTRQASSVIDRPAPHFQRSASKRASRSLDGAMVSTPDKNVRPVSAPIISPISPGDVASSPIASAARTDHKETSTPMGRPRSTERKSEVKAEAHVTDGSKTHSTKAEGTPEVKTVARRERRHRDAPLVISTNGERKSQSPRVDKKMVRMRKKRAKKIDGETIYIRHSNLMLEDVDKTQTEIMRHHTSISELKRSFMESVPESRPNEWDKRLSTHSPFRTASINGHKQPDSPVVKMKTITISDVTNSLRSEITSKDIPIVHTETKTITYESAQSNTMSEKESGMLLSAQTITSETVSTTTTTQITKTVKGGISETRIEKRIVITGDTEIDHDKALAQAIKEAKEQHPDMSVTKVVVHQETEITPE